MASGFAQAWLRGHRQQAPRPALSGRQVEVLGEGEERKHPAMSRVVEAFAQSTAATQQTACWHARIGELKDQLKLS
jgi:hypothetical protein